MDAMPKQLRGCTLKIDNRNYLILSSNLKKTYLFTYILYMKQNSGFVELHNGPPWSKKICPPKNSYALGVAQ